jgi:glutaredoxin 3
MGPCVNWPLRVSPGDPTLLPLAGNDMQREPALADVEIYTQAWCPYCIRAKRLLDSKGVAYREIDASRGTPGRAEAQNRSGRSSVPQIFVDGRHIGGCDDLVAMERSGELDPLLTAA